MDANSLRNLLVIGAAALVVVINFPWRHTARSVTRCASHVTHGPARQLGWAKQAEQLPARRPWNVDERGRVLAVAHLSDTSRYANDSWRRRR